MTYSLPIPTVSTAGRRRFKRRSPLPLERDSLWQIEAGVVRTLTSLENGTYLTLGLWGAGDVVGRKLSTSNPYQIECLTDVEAIVLPSNRWYQASEAMFLHIQRLGEFLEIVHTKPIDAALLRLMTWLAKRFGREIERGRAIDLRLTHQEIAEMIGSSRVTVTRILNEFEKQGIIQRSGRQFVVLQERSPFWHYEI